MTDLLNKLEGFIKDGCDARPEDKHHALQQIAAIRSAWARRKRDQYKERKDCVLDDLADFSGPMGF